MKKQKGKLHLLSSKVFSEFIEHIEGEIFPDTVYHIQEMTNRIEHENTPQTKADLIIETLNSLQQEFMRYFPDFYSFPQTEIDNLNQRVKIRPADLNSYFEATNLFDTDAENLVTGNPDFDNEVKTVIRIDNWEALMKLLCIQEGEHAYHCKYYHLRGIFTDVATYTELRKRFGYLVNAGNNFSSHQQTKTEQEQADTSELINEINHFCKSMPLSIAREHFKVFTETKSKNKEPFLTVEQFNLFIDRAFCGKNDLPKQKFNYTTREKLFIVKRFYQFYSIAVNENGFEVTPQCQPKYIKLLTDNFANWSYESIKNNFGNKVKRDW